jgi:hypothetical protein
MAISPQSIQVGKCYFMKPDRVLLVLAIGRNRTVRYEIRTRLRGGRSTYSLATMSCVRFARAVVREVPCE